MTSIYSRSLDEINKRARIFAAGLPHYAAKYNVDQNDQDKVDDAAKQIEESIRFSRSVDSYKQAVTKWRDELMIGVANNVPLPDLPPSPILPVLPVPVNGALTYIDKMILRVKSHNLYAKGDGEAMGIEAPVPAPIHWATAKAHINYVKVLDNKVLISWRKGKSDGVNLYGSYDGSNFVLLGRKTKGLFIDERKNQTEAGEYRHYQAIFVKNDKEVGKFSDISRVLVDIQ